MSRQLKLIAVLAWKDWKLFLADRRAALLCFAVPIILASAFGIIFDRPGQRMGTTKLPLLIVNEDDSPFTRELVADLLGAANLEARVTNRAGAEEQIASRASPVAVVFPKGFGHIARESEDRPKLCLMHHPLSAVEGQWAEGVVTEVVMKRVAGQKLASLGMSADVQLERPFGVANIVVPAEAQHPFNSYTHSFCGMTLQYLLFWGMESGLLLLRERQRGLWDRLRAAPVPLITALLGRAMATAIIAMLQVLSTFTFGYLVFGVRITGSPIGFALLTLGVSGLAAAVGLLVAALGSTEARARNACIVVILAVSMLGGLWLPAFLLPRWVQEGAKALPTSWAMSGLDGVTWQGLSLPNVAASVGAVVLFSTAFMVLAIGRFSWTESRRRRGVTI